MTLVAIWTMGFELLPNLHVALHAELPHHIHGRPGPGAGESGVVVRVSFAGDHHHGDHHHESQATSSVVHELGRARPRLEGCELVIGMPRPPRSQHGVHSLAHRGLAVAQPAPAVVLPALVAVGLPAAEIVVRQAPRSRCPLCQRVRGPPPVILEVV